MGTTISLAIAGIATGCVYALVALGFVLIWKCTEVVNFAHGELMMLGGFTGLGLATLGWPWPLALAGARLPARWPACWRSVPCCARCSASRTSRS